MNKPTRFAVACLASLVGSPAATGAPPFPLVLTGALCLETGTLPDCPYQAELTLILEADGSGTYNMGGADEPLSWTFDAGADPQMRIQRDLFPSIFLTGNRVGRRCVRGESVEYGATSEWAACR